MEARFDKFDEKLDKISLDLAYVKGKAEAAPTTLQLIGFVIAVLAIAGLGRYFLP